MVLISQASQVLLVSFHFGDPPIPSHPQICHRHLQIGNHFAVFDDVHIALHGTIFEVWGVAKLYSPLEFIGMELARIRQNRGNTGTRVLD